MLKAALASMPTLKVEGTVKADGEVKIAEGATVKLQDGSTVKLADGSVVTVKGTIPAQTQPPIVLPTLKPDENPAIKTTVTVFKSAAAWRWRGRQRLDLRKRQREEPIGAVLLLHAENWRRKLD